MIAIFDDLDKILFMFMLKITVYGMHWEIVFDIFLLSSALVAAWRYMYEINIPSSVSVGVCIFFYTHTKHIKLRKEVIESF